MIDQHNYDVSPNAFRTSFIENIYQNQKKLVQETNIKNKLNKLNNKAEPVEINKYLIFNENDINHPVINWTYAEFDCEELFNEDYPFIKSKWDNANIRYDSEGIDIKNIIFKSNEEILKAEIYVDVVLKEESTFWLFTRTKDMLDINTAVIKLNKEVGLQKVFISFGTFIEDNNGNLIFKVFLKRQLITFSSEYDFKKENVVKNYFEKDISHIKGTILDTGDGKIRAKLFLNDSKIENIVEGDFFLPVVNRFKILLGGTGVSVWVKSFYAKYMKMELEDDTILVSSDRKMCDCCIII